MRAPFVSRYVRSYLDPLVVYVQRTDGAPNGCNVNNPPGKDLYASTCVFSVPWLCEAGSSLGGPAGQRLLNDAHFP